MENLRKDIELLEQKAAIFSDLDRVRFDEIMRDIKALELKWLELDRQSNIVG